jgi:hypothetical protein
MAFFEGNRKMINPLRKYSLAAIPRDGGSPSSSLGTLANPTIAGAPRKKGATTVIPDLIPAIDPGADSTIAPVQPAPRPTPGPTTIADSTISPFAVDPIRPGGTDDLTPRGNNNANNDNVGVVTGTSTSGPSGPGPTGLGNVPTIAAPTLPTLQMPEGGPPSAPRLSETATMPTMNSAAVREAGTLADDAIRRRQGRRSTMLTTRPVERPRAATIAAPAASIYSRRTLG